MNDFELTISDLCLQYLPQDSVIQMLLKLVQTSYRSISFCLVSIHM